MSTTTQSIKEFINTPIQSKVIESELPKVKLADKIYDLTGRASYENIHIKANRDKGRELILSYIGAHGAEVGDTLLIDRPHHKSVPYKIMDVKYLEQNPDAGVAHVKFIEENIGGYKGALRLRFKKSLARQ